jgi:hypothetical protein
MGADGRVQHNALGHVEPSERFFATPAEGVVLRDGGILFQKVRGPIQQLVPAEE